jgi:hypothetical protein
MTTPSDMRFLLAGVRWDRNRGKGLYVYASETCAYLDSCGALHTCVCVCGDVYCEEIITQEWEHIQCASFHRIHVPLCVCTHMRPLCVRYACVYIIVMCSNLALEESACVEHHSDL